MLRFVVALQAEARPIVDRFRMEGVFESHPFRVYRGDGAWLIVSGLGKAAAAAATAYLHLLSGGVPGRVWLNVGIGGHGRHLVGDSFLAHKVTDQASGLSWYPQLVIDALRPTASMLTVEKVEEEYSPPWIYETQAAGFFPTASRFSTVELVHCFKVISDNPDATLSRRMSSSFIQSLIEQNLRPLQELARGLAGLARELETLASDPPGYSGLLSRWQLTVVEQRRLRRLLQRLAVLAPGELYGGAELGAAREAREVLQILEARLSEIPIRLGAPASAPAGVPLQ
jgi:adenosylhomocysteine nucleosidase